MTNKRLKSGNVLLIAVLFAAVVVFALIFAFFNFNLGKKVTFSDPNPNVVEDEQIRNLNTLSDSDEVGAIEADINSTNFDNLDQEINQVDQDLSNL